MPFIVERRHRCAPLFGHLLAGGLWLGTASPASAQVNFSLGNRGTSPSVSFGQPAYNNGYYAQQPGYTYGQQPGYTYAPQQPGYTYAPQQPGYYTPQPGTYVQNPPTVYPPNRAYSSGYNGYYTQSRYAQPAPYYGNQTYPGYAPAPNGVYLNVPSMGNMRLR